MSTTLQYLIVVDTFTRWVEVIPIRTANTTWTAQELRKIFSTFGYPYVLVPDNGKQFVSQHLEDFLKTCGIIHKTITPYHPSSNGQVERKPNPGGSKCKRALKH
uniref:Integrase catalytic domain-containing protein n=1 Tax=Graphocephala atropunctata TaxID=36148 RepID=A0A1B6LHK5_9HEMI